MTECQRGGYIHSDPSLAKYFANVYSFLYLCGVYLDR
jgi:hypothetical protein